MLIMLQLTKILFIDGSGFRKLLTPLALGPVDLFIAWLFIGCINTGWLFACWLLSGGRFRGGFLSRMLFFQVFLCLDDMSPGLFFPGGFCLLTFFLYPCLTTQIKSGDVAHFMSLKI